jgi:DNA-binding GntR family transcriptional regulator
VTKTDTVYAALRERILQGIYRPGQRLVPANLKAEFGVSTIPIREAFRRLEAEGWITYRANVGAEVRGIDVTDWVMYLDALAPLTAHATALAAPRLGADKLAQAREANLTMRACMERADPIAANDWNLRFHAILVSGCPNAYVRELVGQIVERLEAIRRVVVVLTAGRNWEAIEEHDELLALIENGAAAAEIESFTREHTRRTIRVYLGETGDGSERLGAMLAARSAALMEKSA